MRRAAGRFAESKTFGHFTRRWHLTHGAMRKFHCRFPRSPGYRDKRTRDFAEGHRVPAYEALRRQAEIRLDRLEAAPNLNSLRGFPGNRLEALIRNRKGQFSTGINDQDCICFEWPDGATGPSNVEIADDH